MTKVWLAVISCACIGAFLKVDGADQPSPAANAPVELNAQEKSFKELLTNCQFVGRWRIIQEGQLGEEREEKYSITGANKLGHDNWVIFARIQYGQRDLSVPITVQVKWAGETPVITLSNVAIGNLGTYSARVVVHEKMYAGIWSAGDHGGLLEGIIKKAAPAKKP